MKHGPTITVSLRKTSTGYRVMAFCTDDLNGAYLIAQVLIASPTYNRCYAVGTNWEGNVVFEVRGAHQGHPQALAHAPQPQALPQQGYQYPAPQQYQQRQQEYRAVLPPIRISRPQLPQHEAYKPEPQVIDNRYGVRMLPSGGQKR